MFEEEGMEVMSPKLNRGIPGAPEGDILKYIQLNLAVTVPPASEFRLKQMQIVGPLKSVIQGFRCSFKNAS